VEIDGKFTFFCEKRAGRAGKFETRYDPENGIVKKNENLEKLTLLSPYDIENLINFAMKKFQFYNLILAKL
jgi:hypothetical protein